MFKLKYMFLKAEKKIFLDGEVIRKKDQNNHREWDIKCKILKKSSKKTLMLLLITVDILGLNRNCCASLCFRDDFNSDIYFLQ